MISEIGYDGWRGRFAAASTFSSVPRFENSNPRTVAEPAQYFKKCLLETLMIEFPVN
jgi:hypothetical protein